MADLSVLLQYAHRIKDRLSAQQQSFAEKLKQVVKQWKETDLKRLTLADYQAPKTLPELESYSVLAADSSPLELSRHRAVELKAVSLARVFTDYRQAEETIDRQIIDLEKDDVASLSNPLLELEYAVRSHYKPQLVLIDGSLIRWQWEQLLENRKKDLVSKYVELLVSSYQNNAPVMAIIDRSQGRDVLEQLEKLAGEHYTGLVDEDLFDLVLSENTFSPVFRAVSPILSLHPDYQIGYVYYRSAIGVLRIEFLLQQNITITIWSQLIDQVQKGKGFPFVIARAHDCCVVKAKDKLLLEQNLYKFGRMSQKERLKRLG